MSTGNGHVVGPSPSPPRAWWPELADAQLAGDPLVQLAHWVTEGTAMECHEASAAVLATARPSARVVRIERLEHGAVFFASHTSEDGMALALDPRASLCFGWRELGRRVRLAGAVLWLAAVESDALFGALPRDRQLLAWVADDRRVLPNRGALEASMARAEARFAGQEVPRPRHLVGCRLVPAEVEVCQERSDGCLDDRFRYRRSDDEGSWVIERLSP